MSSVSRTARGSGRFPGWKTAGVSVAVGLAAAVALSWSSGRDERELSRQTALLNQYCIDCHNEIDLSGNLALDVLEPADPAAHAEAWEAVVRKLRTGLMPPAGEPRPERAALETLAAYLERQLDAASAEAPNPGAPSLHRLNRTEYANAIRDLLALQADASTLLPADDAAEGFDNIAGVLTVSPSLIEGYVSAAMKLSRRAVGDPGMLPKTTTYRAPADLDQSEHIEGLPLGTHGGMLVTHDFPLDAEYEFRISAAGCMVECCSTHSYFRYSFANCVAL